MVPRRRQRWVLGCLIKRGADAAMLGALSLPRDRCLYLFVSSERLLVHVIMVMHTYAERREVSRNIFVMDALSKP